MPELETPTCKKPSIYTDAVLLIVKNGHDINIRKQTAARPQVPNIFAGASGAVTMDSTFTVIERRAEATASVPP